MTPTNLTKTLPTLTPTLTNFDERLASFTSESSDESEVMSASDEDIEEAEDVMNDYSHLDPGPELMPSLDPNSGRLIFEWEDEIEDTVEDGNMLDEDDEDASEASECGLNSDIESD